jgi:ribosome-binding ATPase YchF (GTP1/OBG family)
VLAVARCFGIQPDPGHDLEETKLDLVLADLASVERRLELVAKEARVGKKDAALELQVLESAKAHLDAGLPLRTLRVDNDGMGSLDALFAATLKPSVYLANLDDSLLPDGGEPAAKVERLAVQDSARAVKLSAQLELELSELDPTEREEYRQTYGLSESGLGAVARAVWEAGGLITYFTAGEPEVRAWPVEAGSPAPVAASKIHSDFEKHFIRAEVTSVEELVEAGSMEALRAAGRLRVEGRDYVVTDGDVVFFRVGR